MKRKAQVWYTDFMLGFLIFTISVFIYYGYAYSIDQDPADTTTDLLMEAKSISSSLISQGSPSDWNQSNVQMIGITDGNQRVMQDKLDMFAGMTYGESKTKLRTPYNYYFYLEDMYGIRIDINGLQGIGMQGNSSEDLVSITRIVVYNSTLVHMVVHVWE